MKMKRHHYRAMELLLQGVKHDEIAKDIGCDKATLRWWLKDEQFMAEMERQRQALRETVTAVVTGQLMTEAPPSVAKMIELRDNAKSERVQLAAAEGILNKAGFKEVEKVAQISAITVTPELLEAVKMLSMDMQRLPTEFHGLTALPERGGSGGG